MLRALGRLLGFVEDKYHHIVSDYEKLKTRLLENADYHETKVVEHVNEIVALREKQAASQNEVTRSKNAVAKLTEIFG